MKRSLLFLSILLSLAACTTKESNLVVSGNIVKKRNTIKKLITL